MPKPIKSSSEKGTTKKEPWLQILRDERGRWKKGQRVISSKETAATVPSAEEKTSKTARSTKTITQKPISEEKPKESEEKPFDCPRCGGIMRDKPIRCGLERVITVKLCKLCNFFVPIT